MHIRDPRGASCSEAFETHLRALHHLELEGLLRPCDFRCKSGRRDRDFEGAVHHPSSAQRIKWPLLGDCYMYAVVEGELCEEWKHNEYEMG